MCRTWRSPMMPASAARAGIAFFTSVEPATSAWRVIAPISTALPETLIPASSLMVPRSMRSVGEESRSFIACTRLCPPARYLPSSFLEPKATASLVLEGRWYSNACIACLLAKMFPYGLRRRRHRHVLHAKGVGDRVHHRRGSADRARLAAAFDAERVVRARRLARVDLELRYIARARDAVVHERAGDELAGGLVAAALGERLADALGEPAVHLPFDDHRIDDLSEVVDRGERRDLRRAGVAVHLHFAHVAARGEGEVGRVVEGVLVQTGLELVERVVVRHVGGKGDLAEGLLAVGPRDLELAAVVLDVRLRSPQQVPSDLL